MSDPKRRSKGGVTFKDESERRMYVALQQNPHIQYNPDEDEMSPDEYYARNKNAKRVLTPAEKARLRAEKKRKKREKTGRIIFYSCLGVYALILIILCARFLSYVDDCLVKYEASQDYNAIDTLVGEFTNAVKDGSISTMVELPESAGVFEPKDTFVQMYVQNMQSVTSGGGAFTYKKNTRSYDASAPVYDIYSGEDMVARMTLKSTNQRSVFAILELCDWEIDKIEPVLSVQTSNYRYSLPENYKLLVNGVEVTVEFQKGEIVKKDYKLSDEILNYVSFPGTITYEITGLVNAPTVQVLDAQGNVSEAMTFDEQGNGSLVVDDDFSATLPEDRKAYALETAEMWADFTNKDLKGSNYGLATMQARLVKDSYFYQFADSYAHGVDITFVSDHVDASPKFSDITVSEYKEYTDTLYSVRCIFTKNMYTKGQKFKSITTDSTFFFLYIDDSEDGVDNPHWCMIDMVATTNN